MAVFRSTLAQKREKDEEIATHVQILMKERRIAKSNLTEEEDIFILKKIKKDEIKKLVQQKELYIQIETRNAERSAI